MQEMLEDYARLVIGVFQKANITLDYSIDSLRQIDNFFETNAKNGQPIPGKSLDENTDQTILYLGGYVAVTLLRSLPGAQWQLPEKSAGFQIEDVAIRFHDKDGQENVIWPMEKTFKRFHNGAEDSLWGYGVVLARDAGVAIPVPRKKPWWKFW